MFRLRLEDPESLRLGRKASAVFLLAGCLAIVGWQAISFERRAELDTTYGISGSRGLYPGLSQRFFYFFYYTGKFPLSIEPPGLELEYSGEAAHALLDSPGLFNESYAFVRTGDLCALTQLAHIEASWASPLEGTSVPPAPFGFRCSGR